MRIGRLWTMIGVLALATIAATPPLASAGDGLAGDDGAGDDWLSQYFSTDDFGDGVCDPGTVTYPQVVTCRFPLVGDADKEFPEQFHAVVEPDFPAADANKALPFASSRCSLTPVGVDPVELVCEDLLPGYEPGVKDVILRTAAWEESARQLASVEVVEQDHHVANFAPITRVKTVVAGSDWTLVGERTGSGAVDCVPAGGGSEIEEPQEGDIETSEYEPGSGEPLPSCDDPVVGGDQRSTTAPVDVFARHVDSDVVTVQARLLDAGQDNSSDTTIRLDPPGRYDMWTCEVAEDGTCAKEGMSVPVHALRPEVEPLVPGQTTDDAESRIHVVAVGAGWDGDEDAFRAAAYRMLGLDLSVADETGVLGPFGIEPLRSNVGRFDFWFLPDLSPSRLSVNWADGSDRVSTESLGLGRHVLVVNLSRNGAVDGGRANANVPTLFGAEDLGEKEDIRFGDFYLPFNFNYDTEGLTTSAHEYGHALLGLPDEYVETQGVPFVRNEYPSCASSEEEAESWWADQVGEVDPFFEEWLTIVDYSEATVEDIAVGYFPGGCFGGPDSTEAIRPTKTSIMNDERVQVFGAVQRRQAERILSLWDEPDPDDNTFDLVAAEVASLGVDLPATAEEYEATRPPIDASSAPSDDPDEADDADDTGDTSTSTPDDLDTEIASGTGDGDDGGISPVWIVVLLAAIAAGGGAIYLRRRNTA